MEFLEVLGKLVGASILVKLVLFLSTYPILFFIVYIGIVVFYRYFHPRAEKTNLYLAVLFFLLLLVVWQGKGFFDGVRVFFENEAKFLANEVPFLSEMSLSFGYPKVTWSVLFDCLLLLLFLVYLLSKGKLGLETLRGG